MAWFDRQKPDQPSVPKEKYTVEDIQALLDEIGMLRPKVNAPRVKVLLTRIAQQGESCLIKRSHNGSPSATDVVRFQKQLEVVLRVIQQYVVIQENPNNYPNPREELRQGYESVRNFAKQLFETSSSASSSGLIDYRVDARILSTQHS